MKRAIIILLTIGILVVVAGCARWPNGPNGNGGTENRQLEITVEVNEKGEINTGEGIYYIVFYTDRTTGPGPNVDGWEGDFYYIKLDGIGFHFLKVKDDKESSFYGEGNKEGNSLQVIVSLSELEDPENININVITTSSKNYTYDSLDDGYFPINAKILGSIPDILDDLGDSQDGENFDIKKVTAKITIP